MSQHWHPVRRDHLFADPERVLALRWGEGLPARAGPQAFTYPALLLFLLGVSVLAAADAGVAGDAVEAGDAI